jgi:hypothetical protein
MARSFETIETGGSCGRLRRNQNTVSRRNSARRGPLAASIIINCSIMFSAADWLIGYKNIHTPDILSICKKISWSEKR